MANQRLWKHKHTPKANYGCIKPNKTSPEEQGVNLVPMTSSALIGSVKKEGENGSLHCPLILSSHRPFCSEDPAHTTLWVLLVSCASSSVASVCPARQLPASIAGELFSAIVSSSGHLMQQDTYFVLRLVCYGISRIQLDKALEFVANCPKENEIAGFEVRYLRRLAEGTQGCGSC